ncbi:MAG: hypothetical protein NTZ90_09575, partial [Proteobacteria bacterium]|nr:hypothetical protein [Pseudomonadota bacterium]
TFATVNASSSLQVKIVGGQVLESHAAALQISNKPLYLEVRYVSNAAAAGVATVARPGADQTF